MNTRFLIVDDEQSILFAMDEYFATLSYKVDCANDLATAKALLSAAEYPLIIADLRLGGSDNQDGLEVVACAHQQYPKTRIVLLTAHGSAALTAEAQTRGADVVLNKPTSLPTLARIVTELLGNTARTSA